MPLIILILLVILLTVLIVGFIFLFAFLLPAISQLKKTLADLELTSAEVRLLAQELKKTAADLQLKLQMADQILVKGKKVVEGAGEISGFIQKNIIHKSVGLLAFLPAVKFGWKLIKKIKGGKENE